MEYLEILFLYLVNFVLSIKIAKREEETLPSFRNIKIEVMVIGNMGRRGLLIVRVKEEE